MGKPQTKSAKQFNGFADEAESEGQSSYLRFEAGDTKFRIISKPLMGWIVWEEDEDETRKPVRSSIEDGEPDAPSKDPKDKPKKFMTVVVIDREDGEVKVLEITQQSVIKGINAYAKNPDWGNPFSYDITVTKKGEGKKTRYGVQPSPKKALDKEAIKAANAKPCNLDALFTGENPWEVEGNDVTEYHFK